MKLPLAEHFHSLQGEGTWVGTPMHFIRLAGCSVGTHPAKLIPSGSDPPNLNPSSQFNKTSNGSPAWRCEAWDSRSFFCDTDFSFKESVEIETLLAETFEHHVCITGGEPLMHREALLTFLPLAQLRGKTIHIETSGTILPPFPTEEVWLTVAPKAHCLPYMWTRADEIKLLVDSAFDINKVSPYALRRSNVFLSPVNSSEGGWDESNLQLCMDLLKAYPQFRLSVQLHKILKVR